MKSLMVCLVGLLVSVHASPVSPPVISGQVRLADGSPVAGASVVLFDVADLAKGPVGQATTDEAGQFALALAASAALVLPQGFALGPNYPNPFNPSTIIPYQLAAPSPVRLEIFNILGQHLTTLVDAEQAAGSYRARWDGTDAAGRAAASGVYFYRLTVAGAHQTGRMVLVDGQVGVPAGGARVAAVPLAAGSTGSYGLVVSGEGLVAYVDAAFSGAARQGPVDLVVEAQPQARGKVGPVDSAVETPPKVWMQQGPMLDGLLGDVDNSGHVDRDDGLLVAMHRVDPAVSLPNHGQIGLGDVDCNGKVERADVELLATYVVDPSAAAVSSLRIGQRGGYSLDPVTEVVWGSILGTEQQDATVARLLDEVPVLVSGVFEMDGRDYLYLGIDRDYYTQYGGEHIYNTLKQRFPITPLIIEPSDGIQQQPEPGPARAKRVTDEPAAEPEEKSDDDSLFSLFDVFDDATEGPDLAVSRTTASPTSVQPGDTLTVRARITNIGTEDAPSANVHVYRHTATTTDPRRIGTRETTATATDTLLVPNASVAVAVQNTAPAVSSTTTYYYYVCVDAADGEPQIHNNCSGTPAIATVRFDSATPDEVVPATPEDETPEPTKAPNLTVSSLFLSPDITESGTQVAVRVIVKNDGTASARSETIRLYRHTSRTSNPTSGGSRLATTATTGNLAAGAQVTRTITASVPSVTADATYYYYACVSAADDEVATGDNCAGPAEVLAYPSTFHSGPKRSYEDCFVGFPTASPRRKTPMGGDALLVKPFTSQHVVNCGTITLGGVETTDGVRGFIVTGHTVAESGNSAISTDNTNTLIGHYADNVTYKLRHLLGKVFKMPSTRTEGGRKILSVDAAFVKYPQPQRSNCSVKWQEGGDSFCLDDTDQDNYIDRITPLTIRGKNGDTYKVVGSKRPTKGLKVTYSGVVSGPSKKTGIVGEKVLAIMGGGRKGRYLYVYLYPITPHLGSLGGDSGSPIYTTPDINGNVHIVGVISGSFSSDILGRVMSFSSWDEVAEDLNLKPISP